MGGIGHFHDDGHDDVHGPCAQIGASNFNNLTINVGSGNTATLTGNAIVAGNLTLQGAVLDVNGQTLDLRGAVASSVSSSQIENTGGSGGNVELDNSSAVTDFDVAGGTTLTVSAQVTSGATSTGLDKTDTGTLTLSNNTNSYVGGTAINGGVLKVTVNHALGATGAGNGTTVNGGGTLDFSGVNYFALEQVMLDGGHHRGRCDLPLLRPHHPGGREQLLQRRCQARP